MSASVQAEDDVHTWIDPQLLTEALKENFSREEQLRNPLSRAVADLNPDRQWDAIFGRQQEVEYLHRWVTRNFGEHTFHACTSDTACTWLAPHPDYFVL